jgi:hypothetical protein
VDLLVEKALISLWRFYSPPSASLHRNKNLPYALKIKQKYIQPALNGPYDKKVERDKLVVPLQIPKPIYNLGVINVIVSVGLLFFGFLGWGNFGFPAPLDQKLFGGCLIALSLAGLVSSLVLISVNPRKHLWHALMSYWVLLLVLFTAWDISRLDNIIMAFSEGHDILFITFGPIIYSIFCLAFFLTNGTKKYFSLTEEKTSKLKF